MFHKLLLASGCRNDLFDRINELPTIFDIVTGATEEHVKDTSKLNSKRVKETIFSWFSVEFVIV